MKGLPFSSALTTKHLTSFPKLISKWNSWNKEKLKVGG